MRISLITVCYNSVTVIRAALESVLAQKGAEIEYIVVDGGSTDGTQQILEDFAEKVKVDGHGQQRNISFCYISECDNGMYDALNKGIRISTGEVVGWLNADDVLASDDVLSKIVTAFEENPTLDGTFADIRFVSSATSLTDFISVREQQTIRYCSGKRFRPWMFRFGTQTAHPSTFFRRACFEKWGFYSLDFGMFGDFELLCRFIWRYRAKIHYIPLCTTVMRAGGASTNGWRTTIRINRTDLRALKANGCWSCYLFLYSRYLFKIWGFLSRP